MLNPEIRPLREAVPLLDEVADGGEFIYLAIDLAFGLKIRLLWVEYIRPFALDGGGGAGSR
jgi:hypothetical protein